VDIIYFDFAKAFDSVPHTCLLTKLKSYGLTGNLLRWLESYLVGRKQRVFINGETSAWCDVLGGVPYLVPYRSIFMQMTCLLKLTVLFCSSLMILKVLCDTKCSRFPTITK